MYAQGDILLIPADAPETHQVLQTPSVIVGFGESSGHSHVLVGEVAEWLVDSDETPETLHEFAMGDRLARDLFVNVPMGGQLQHQKGGKVITYDHMPIDIPPGTYRVVRQRTATIDMVRAVAD